MLHIISKALIMEKQQLAKLANHLKKKTNYNEVKIKRTQSNFALVEKQDAPTKKKSKEFALKVRSKQGKKRPSNKSSTKVPKKKEEVKNASGATTLEDRIKAIENKMPEILNDLLKTKEQSNVLETKMSHFQSDLELTKKAYSELIYHELSKSSANISILPSIKLLEQKELSSKLDSKTNQILKRPSKAPKGHTKANSETKVPEKKDTQKIRKLKKQEKKFK